MRSAVIISLIILGCGRDRSGESSAAAPSDAVRGATAVAAAPVDAAAPDAAPPFPPIAWVDPARCLTPCTFDPGDALVRVNRTGKLDPDGKFRVDPAVVEPLGRLIAAAKAAGYRLRIESGYRSYDEQAEIFRTTEQVGRAARPGHSEHQLGTAVDLDMPTRKSIAWLAEHALDHGFVVSYPPGKQRITGYRPEPWHVRYVGDEVAAELRRAGGTLDELLRARPGLGRAGGCDDCPAPESRAACGDVPAAGRCDGTILRWCFDGALAAVDCAVSHLSCGPDAATGQLDCVEPPRAPDVATP
jgi:D-alanyl-D-alanine carboxypeptidase